MPYRFLRWPDGKAKAVTFSYDDGVRHDIRLAETCNRHGIKCTFNLNSGYISKDPGKNKLTADEIRQYLLAPGHEIAIHGKFHLAPGNCRPIDTIQDILACRLELEEEFGCILQGMAYPDTGITKFTNGAAYPQIRQNLIDLGILYARTLAGDNNSFQLPTDWYAWMPTARHANPKALDYATEFATLDVDAQYVSSRAPRLFYLWGHSYEFHNADNWELLEALCDTLGGLEDTWYATNIDICRYTRAYDALVFSADGSLVHNPTVTRVWFDQGGKLYSVASGETRKLT